MHPFEQLIYSRFADSIRSWDTQRHPDIYAVSVLIKHGWTSDEAGNDVALEGFLSLSFNTLSHFRSQIDNASDAAEAKWNFAFWLQEFTATVPRLHDPEYGTQPDEDELALRDAWCASLNILPTGEDGAGRPTYGAGFDEAIAAACERVVRRLHEDNVITAILGKPVPVIIHTLEYDQPGLNATQTANPARLLDEFNQQWASGG
jgi:hypothetical protein